MHNIKLILDFLADLRENNQKEWMDANRSRFERAKEEFKSLVSYILESMKQYDPALSALEAKDCIFRINRDIRFSKDKTPYKSWMSAVFSEGGKKSMNPLYYLHLQPGNETMAAAGLYEPTGDQMRKIRQEIDYNAPELKEIITTSTFVQNFGEIQGEKLSRAPKGYQPDHPNIEFLKLKSYVAIRKFSDKDALDANFADEVVTTFRAAQPFNEFLNVAVS